MMRLPRKLFLVICFFGDLRWNLKHVDAFKREWRL